MGMMDQGLSPGVQDGEKPDRSTQMGRVGGNGAECLGRRPEEDVVDDRFVLQGDRGDRLRAGEHDVKGLGLEEVGLAGRDPPRAGQRLARRAVPVATGVVPDARVATAVTLLDVAAERGRPTPFEGGHHPSLCRRQRGPGIGAIRVAIAADDVRYGGDPAVHRPISARCGGRRERGTGLWE